MHDDELSDIDHARLDVDVDHCRHRTEAPGHRGRNPVVRLGAPRVHARRQPRTWAGRRSTVHLAEAHFARWDAPDAHLASRQFEVSRLGLEQLTGDRPNPRLQPLRAFEDRGPGRHHAARRERTHAVREQRRVAGAEHDLLGQHAKGVGHDL